MRIGKVFTAAFAASLIVLGGVNLTAHASDSGHILVVNGVQYNSYQHSGPVIHWETPPGVNPISASFAERNQVWDGNGSGNLPCPGGIHWISNNNTLNVSHCLEVVVTTSSTTTTTTTTTTTVPEETTTTTTTVPELGCVDLNSGSIEDLIRLNGVNTILAQKIVDGRPYTSVQDVIVSVSGIGPQNVDFSEACPIVPSETTTTVVSTTTMPEVLQPLLDSECVGTDWIINNIGQVALIVDFNNGTPLVHVSPDLFVVVPSAVTGVIVTTTIPPTEQSLDRPADCQPVATTTPDDTTTTAAPVLPGETPETPVAAPAVVQSEPTLAVTGVNIWGLLLSAVGLTIIGYIIVKSVRRKSKTEESIPEVSGS